MKMGSGLGEDTVLGPVITREARERIAGCIAEGEREGAALVLDGRGATVPGQESGFTT